MMEFLQYPQENDAIDIANKIMALENTAWPQNTQDTDFPSEPSTYVTSFVWMEADLAVCHVGVRKSTFCHKGESYLAYGLSEVVTHPRYQKRGLAFRAVQKAAQFIASQQPDLSIFTCAEERVGFYTKCGYKAIPGACFVGGTREKPFRSDSLKLVTMMRFLSPKSKRHRNDFEHTDIMLELGEGQLW